MTRPIEPARLTTARVKASAAAKTITRADTKVNTTLKSGSWRLGKGRAHGSTPATNKSRPFEKTNMYAGRAGQTREAHAFKAEKAARKGLTDAAASVLCFKFKVGVVARDTILVTSSCKGQRAIFLREGHNSQHLVFEL
eukprot:CAMPEP_0171684248 /NCGR_PEP_ID=MMETSP0991-20121206/1575_1 /TAXON_ID=483369 /ORGANISM="non described non described, Strain CCMP2098" /LENGTH=138 /DNA_ID=CAMNT_0012271739 /DNA_START=220 /DNA_END=631 /DNA_ORIENTATION=-